MIDENFLKAIGFTEFVHLNKAKRDEYHRLASVKIIENQWFTIQLIKKHDQWEVEKILFDGDSNIFKKYFPTPPTLENVIDAFFKKDG